jgi:hypothetical protein
MLENKPNQRIYESEKYMFLILSVYQFLTDMICLALIVFKVCIEVIRKEKDTQYGKNDKKLYQYQYPKGSADCHTPETVAVKGK